MASLDAAHEANEGERVMVTDSPEIENEIRALYERVLDAWNRRSGDDFAAAFCDDGEVIGFDGSQNKSRAVIASEMNRIFADHPTGRYVGIVKNVRAIGRHAALLRAVAGVVPAGRSDIEPKLNSIQALVAEQSGDGWRVVLYQNTPAQFHGRDDLAKKLSNELREELRQRRELVD
jgi:uncharacterized protein (TIGR02246 family)